MSGWRLAASPSLQRELRRWLLLPLLLLVPLSAALIYGLALRPALDGLDRALTDTVVALAEVLQRDGDRVSLPLSAQTERALRADPVDRINFAAGDDAGRLIGGRAELLALAPALPAGGWRFFEAVLDGQPVRVAAHALACRPAAPPCLLMVAETLGKRAEAERAVLLAALLGAAMLALPSLLLGTLAVRRAMRPLHQAAAEVATRSPARLDPLDARTMPAELQAFVQALNELFARLQVAADAQRAFVADAAHQLRTPLAVLQLEATQVLQQAHPPALQPALHRLQAAAERGARLAQQLLTLARTEAADLARSRQAQQPVDLARLAAEAAERWLPLALDQGQDLGFALAPATVPGDALLLGELLGNLVHNAIAHAGAGARITVRTGTLHGAAWLVVEDDGPGIADDEAALLWQRFHRGRAAQGTGSGLGLAIVQDIARLHGATATLARGDGGQGLSVRVQFAAAAAAAVPG